MKHVLRAIPDKAGAYDGDLKINCLVNIEDPEYPGRRLSTNLTLNVPVVVTMPSSASALPIVEMAGTVTVARKIGFEAPRPQR